MVTGNYFLSNGNILLALKCLALFPKINSPSPKSIIYFPEPIQRKRKQAASDMDVSLIYCTILLNLDLKSQHQFNNRLFWFFYPYLALLAKHLVLAKAATSAL
ncbi:hypothetical protein V6Z11_A06G161500 [Gossypium hirsutum]